MNPNLPMIYDEPMLTRPYMSGMYGTYPTFVSQSPETVLAETSPRLAAEVLKKQALLEAHERIVGPVGLEIARHGGAIRALTRYTWFGGVETTIERY